MDKWMVECIKINVIYIKIYKKILMTKNNIVIYIKE